MLQFLTFGPMNQISGDPIRLRHVLLGWTCVLSLTGILPSNLLAQSTSGPNSTPEWHQAVAAFQALASEHENLTTFQVFGTSDVGRPLHLFTIGSPTSDLRILINNAIHPGEPCGVNASIAWATELLENPEQMPDNTCIAIVPMYNVGGGLRRNCCTRANQLGPEEYGFRGNARNLDLNRDFIKCDSRNALAFNEMFVRFDPDIFVDTHTSNGADYQPALTLITTQPDKLGGPLAAWLENDFAPQLYARMAKRGERMIPYVNSIESTPDGGIVDFLETPRYSTGYGALHHAIGFTTEAHMLKPFSQRVSATLEFLRVLLETAAEEGGHIRNLRQQQRAAFLSSALAPVAWEADTTAIDSLSFPGYTARYEWSNVTGSRRLRYDREAPYEKAIPYLHTFQPTRFAPIPEAFVVPQAWRHVVERLDANGVQYGRVPEDTTMVLEVTTILAHSASPRPYEGHHYRTVEKVQRSMEPVRLYKGDLIIPMNQSAARYLVETLSPEGVDAFMAWNFFDSALQQKEYFSAYVFEETAEAMLREDADLNAKFEEEKAQKGAAWSSRAQLDWLYKRSPHYEGTASRYPVFSIPKGQPVPFQRP